MSWGIKKEILLELFLMLPSLKVGKKLVCVYVLVSLFFFAKPGTTIDNQNESIVNHIKSFSVLN